MDVLRRLTAHTRAVTNLALGLALAALITIEAAVTDGQPRDRLVVVVVGGIAGGLALMRERAPAGAAAAGIGFCGAAAIASAAAGWPPQPGISATAALLVLGTACVRVATARKGTVIAAAGVALLVLSRFGARPALVLPLVLLSVMVWGAALGLGLWLRTLDLHRQMAVDATRRDDRLELARELHDLVAHHVAGIVVQAQGGRLVAAKDPATAEETLADIETAGADALAAMRRVVGLLRDADDRDGAISGLDEIRELVERLERLGFSVDLRLPSADDPAWPPEVATTVHRVVQESLTNVVQHARGARNVTLAVEADVDEVTVEVTDDAPTGAVARSWFSHGSGYGLIGMRERVEALGGRLRVGPEPERGWGVRVTLPLARLPLGTSGEV